MTPDYNRSDRAGNGFERPISLWGMSLAKPDFGYPDDSKDRRENQNAPCAS